MALPSTIAAAILDPGKPEVPEYVPVDLRGVLQETLSANLGGIPRIERLASAINQFNTEQDLKTLEQLFPGAGAIMAQASQNIQAAQRGELPEGLQQQLQQQFTERARSQGVGVSEFGLYGEGRGTRDIALQQMQWGNTAAERWLAQSRARVPLFNPASMFATPAMGLQNAQFNTANQFNRDWMAEQVDKSLSMTDQAIMNSMQHMDQLILSGAGMFTGSTISGMMGGGGMGGGGSFGGSYMTPMYGQQSAMGAQMLGGAGGYGSSFFGDVNPYGGGMV